MTAKARGSLNCTTCRFAELVQLPPPNLGKARYCLHSPKQIFTIQDRPMAAQPQVADTDFCYQHEPASESSGIDDDAPGAHKGGLSIVKN